MKKIIIFLFCIIIICSSYKENKFYIPDNSIRFRIIANSNSAEDQKIKWEVSNAIIPLLKVNSENYTDAQREINNKIPIIKEIVSNYTDDFEINYGQNYFPIKIYNDLIYPAGNYESLVIKIGDFKGDNWWCVMFPPLCILEAQNVSKDNIKYTTILNEIIKK